ncbi:hypothetical protein Bca4012_008590 [Brassica carinata]
MAPYGRRTNVEDLKRQWTIANGIIDSAVLYHILAFWSPPLLLRWFLFSYLRHGLGEFAGSSSSRHSVPVFLHSVLGEGSSSISSLRAAFGFVEDCTCGYGAIFKGGVLYPFFYSACTLIESDDYKSETHRELATLETT